MIEQILENLGLGEEEIRAYLALSEINQSTAGTLAKHLGVPRPSLYGFLERLLVKGLICQSLNIEGVRSYSVEPPEKIAKLFDQKIDSLKKQQSLYKDLMPELLANRASQLLKPRFQLFEGEERMKHILKDMLLYQDMEIQTLWPIKAMIDILSPEFFRYYNKERIRSNLSIRAIWPQGQTVDTANYPFLGIGRQFKREIRLAPPEIDFTMGYSIYGNKIGFISSRKESFGFIIESAEMAKMLRTQFEMIWRTAVPITTDQGSAGDFLKEVYEN